MDKIQRRSRVFFSLSILLMTSLVYQNCDILTTSELMAFYNDSIKGDRDIKEQKREVAAVSKATKEEDSPIQSSIILSNSNPTYRVDQILEVRPPQHIVVNNFEKRGSGALFIVFDQTNCSYHFDSSTERRHFFKLENCWNKEGEKLAIGAQTSFFIEQSLMLKFNGSFGGGIISTTIDILNLQ